EDVNRSPAFFDEKKLLDFNKAYIRDLPFDEFVERAAAELPSDWDRDRFRAIAPHIQERLERLSDAADAVDFLFVGDGVDPALDAASWAKATTPDWSGALLAEVTDAYVALGVDDWTADTLKATIEEVMARHEVKLGKAQAPVRVAVTGRSVGPPLFESLEVLGHDESIRRLRVALERLANTEADES
ncbi:MAG: glutamate--tRNA ligase, partial [Actinomycetota bacterium]